MDAKYCLLKAAELTKEKLKLEEKAKEFGENLKKVEKLSDKDKRYFSQIIKLFKEKNYSTLVMIMEIGKDFNTFSELNNLNNKNKDRNDFNELDFEVHSEKYISLFEQICNLDREITNWRYFLMDSTPKRFDGDIIITDPCYIREEDDNEFDWLSWSEENGIIRDTIYGDWSCTTYNTDTNEEIGEFCADAGMVCVVSLNDVLKINPDFDYHINRPWTTTLIKDFHGYVYFEVTEEKYEYEGKEEVEYSVHVVGLGNVNFKTSQTGL